MTALTVIGSINLDLVASGAPLPRAGETVTGAVFASHPGGKGANQALAAARLGAQVRLICRVGADPFADQALSLLRADGVDLSAVTVDASATTGVGMIAVSPEGENQIVVAAGANGTLTADMLPATVEGPLILQLELPLETIVAAVERAAGFVAINLAPAMPIPDLIFQRADLIIVNETEAAFYGDQLHKAAGLVALTLGARGAALYRGKDKLAEATPPPIVPVDTTGAGDAFVGALVVALSEGQPHDKALAFACATGALAATRPGAQPSLPTRGEVDTILKAHP